MAENDSLRATSIVTDEAIHQLVDRFYSKVRVDAELAPIFNRAIDEWEPHLATMRDFWSSVITASGRYKGNPVAVHGRIQGLERQLFVRWLELFEETCRELFVESLAREFSLKARRIADSLQLALFYRPDRPWTSGQQ